MTSPWYMGIDLGAQDDSRNTADYTPGAFDGAGFEVGDAVELLTGSPPMVVTDVCGDCGDVGVCWYDDHGGMQVAVLPTEALVYAE